MDIQLLSQTIVWGAKLNAHTISMEGVKWVKSWKWRR
jgi:hypothetical protein